MYEIDCQVEEERERHGNKEKKEKLYVGSSEP